ncbi:MAG: cytochrome b [Tabrizicola sp.]|nr:cytochrome b [Tabrizicola sp.]
MSSPKGYTATQIGLHWIVAVLVMLQLIFGEEIGAAYRSLRQTGIAGYDLMTILHIAVGLLILVFALWRLMLRMRRGVPAPLRSGPKVLDRGAAAVHVLFYLLLIGVPITGLAAWFGGIESAAELHELAKPAFVLLILGHTLAALWHQFRLKDGLITRMLRPGE